MSIERWVMRFAGTVLLLSLLLAHFVSLELALAHCFRRRQPAAIIVHRLLPAGDRPEEARDPARPRIFLSSCASSTQLLNRASLLVILSALCLGAAGCGKSAPPPPARPHRPLASAVVEPVSTPLERDVDGTIEAVNQATVSAQTSGRVMEILYDVNDVVPAGAVIVRLKGTEQRAGLEGRRRRSPKRGPATRKRRPATSELPICSQRRVVSKAQLDQATANRDAAAARLAAAEAGLTAAREGVGYTEIRAPYGGVVTKRLVEVGETVGPGTPLMTGLSLRDLRVDTTIPQSVVMQVRKLKQAAVYVGDRADRGDQDHDFPGGRDALEHLSCAPGPAPRRRWISRPACTSKWASSIGEADRLLVPASAVIERSEVTGVYVLDSKGAGIAAVRTSRATASATRSRSLPGSSAGERIALDPIAASARLATGGGCEVTQPLGLSGRLARFFLENQLTPLLALTALLMGVFAVLVTPREEEPQIDVTFANILIPFPGASSEQVENLVVDPDGKGAGRDFGRQAHLFRVASRALRS